LTSPALNPNPKQVLDLCNDSAVAFADFLEYNTAIPRKKEQQTILNAEESNH
jgi:hypothetical protein